MHLQQLPVPPYNGSSRGTMVAGNLEVLLVTVGPIVPIINATFDSLASPSSCEESQ